MLVHRLREHLVMMIIHRENMKGCKSQQHKCRKESLEKKYVYYQENQRGRR
jgi:hypothetical protein